MSEEMDVVKVVIENSEGELLVVQKSDDYDDLSGKWELVGGKINEELGESRLATARRKQFLSSSFRRRQLQRICPTELERIN